MDCNGVRRSCLAVEGYGIRVSYNGKTTTIDISNLLIERGVIYGLLGPSGCGKTTLLRCIVGLVKPCSGTLRIYGKAPGEKNFAIPGPGVGFMPQELALYPDMTVEETLVHFGKLYQMESSEITQRISFLIDFLNIPDKKKFIKDLSGGQQRRVSFAVALIHKPPLLILDEPTVGVDPLLRKKIWNHLETLAEKNQVTIIITTHYIEEARQANMVGLMRSGRLLIESNPVALIKQYRVSTLEDVFLTLCKDSENTNNRDLQIVTTLHETYKKLIDSPIVLHNGLEFVNNYKQESIGRDDYKLPCNMQDVEKLNGKSSCRIECRATAVRLAALISKNYLCHKRNIPLLFTQVCLPAIMTLICCSALGGDPFGLSMAVVNMEQDGSGYGSRFLTHIDSYFIKQVSYPNLSLALDSVKEGKTWGVVYISSQFTDSLMERYLRGMKVDSDALGNSTVQLYLDFTNKQISGTIYMKISKGFQEFAETMLEKFSMNPKLASPPVILSEPVYSNVEISLTEFMAPAMMFAITYLSTVGISAVSIIIEKRQGLLDRLRIAGIRSWEVVFSIFFVLFFIVMMQSLLVVLCLFYVFHIPCLGSVVWVIVAIVLVGLEGMSFGLLISAICSDETSAVTIILSSYIPTIVLSGVLWSAEALPYYFRWVSYSLPLTLISNTMRSVLSRGWSISDNQIWSGYLVAIAWIIPVILLASFIFKLRSR